MHACSSEYWNSLCASMLFKVISMQTLQITSLLSTHALTILTMQPRSALLVLLLLLAVPPTAFTTTDVYYVTAHDAAGHEQSCPPHQICHNLSYYISQPDSYFTSDTTIIFMEGEHSFDREDRVDVSKVHNLALKGQGQWPVAGAEETVMQSTVIINCTRGRGMFSFGIARNITVEGLTVVNCGVVGGTANNSSNTNKAERGCMVKIVSA